MELGKRTDECFSQPDREVIATSLPKNRSGALLLFENLQAIQFREALPEADAELIDMGPDSTGNDTESRVAINSRRRCLNMRGRGLMLVAGIRMGKKRAQEGAAQATVAWYKVAITE